MHAVETKASCQFFFTGVEYLHYTIKRTGGTEKAYRSRKSEMPLYPLD